MEKKIILLKYQKENGKRPFDEWYAGLDFSIAVKVDARLTRLMDEGHLGDSSILKGADNVIELRFHIGPGYRIYCHRDGKNIVLLLCGGSKKKYKIDA